MSGSLHAQPLYTQGEVNWVFLVEILVTGVLALFFLFYFNRLFATIVCYAIRAYTWHKFRAYVDINALQISLLGGRIFFKSVRYHAHNITLYVHDGHVTWRYWLRTVQEAEIFTDDPTVLPEELDEIASEKSDRISTTEDASSSRAHGRSFARADKAEGQPQKELPCRLSIKVSGVEAFIYNQSPKYDSVVAATVQKAKETLSNATQGRTGQTTYAAAKSCSENGEAQSFGADPIEIETHGTGGSNTNSEKPRPPGLLRLLPVRIECKRAAAAVGNENTANVLTAKVERSVGIVDAAHAGAYDLFKLLFNFEFAQINVALKPNRDYKETQLDSAQRSLHKKTDGPSSSSQPVSQAINKATLFGARLWDWLPHPSRGESGSVRTASLKSVHGDTQSTSNEIAHKHSQWHGLNRYLDDEELDEHGEWQKVEYAKASQLVDVPKVTMRFFWDIPGLVPEQTTSVDCVPDQTSETYMNGTAPPEYGIELGVHGGEVVYGPWADRQRVNMQNVFFPATFVDAIPSRPLMPGEFRVATVFKISIIVEDDVTLRIPAREESKDHRWKSRSTGLQSSFEDQDRRSETLIPKKEKRSKRRKGKNGPPAADARPYAWLDITVKKDSVVNYQMDMYARPTGFRNSLDLDVKGIEMSSSVNHGLLWRSGPLTLDADISYPRSWATIRKWPFNIVCNDLELFILRDHLFLVIDLVNDWASGGLPDFYTFVPFHYQLDITFKNFCMYLNVNDANIINDPADFDKNDFLTLEGQLHAVLGIPMEHYRPKRNQITFEVLAERMQMRLLSPPKSTLRTFVENRQMATLPKLTLRGSFNANQESGPGLTDVLRMDIVGSGLSLFAYGFFIRQLINVKENYFGDYLHFKTLEEFQGAANSLDDANVKLAAFPKPQSANELDVILCIVAEDAAIHLPTNLYTGKNCVRAELPRANLDLRITSYYLDMGLNLSPLSIFSESSEGMDDESSAHTISRTQLYISRVDLNGHRAFGLPPNELSYVSEWDVDVGRVVGELSSSFVRDLASAGRSLAFTISDEENVLPVTTPAIFSDVTFVQVRTDVVRLWLHVANDAILLATDPIKVETSDWAGDVFSQRVTVLAPRITLACVDARSALRHRATEKKKVLAKTYAFVETGVVIDVVGRRSHFATEVRSQQRHLRANDQRTNRAPFLFHSSNDNPTAEDEQKYFDPPALPYPLFPPPINRRFASESDPPSMRLRRKSDSERSERSKASASLLSASIRVNSRSVPTTEDDSQLSRNLGLSLTPYANQGLSRASQSSWHLSKSHQYSHNIAQEQERSGQPSPTMAFSSSYAEPYFRFETLQPDETFVPPYPSTTRVTESNFEDSTAFSEIDDSDVQAHSERSSIFIHIKPGIRAFFDPHVAMTASHCLRQMLPTQPEDIMDTFQMSVLSSIQSAQAEHEGSNQITEIRAAIPAAHLRVVNGDNSDQTQGQADIRVDSLESLIRVNSKSRESGPNKVIALHTMIAALEMCLQNPTDARIEAPAVRIKILDILAWFALAKTNAIHMSLRDSSISIASTKVGYLISLTLGLLPMIEDLKSRFEDILQTDAKRLQFLTYVLTQCCDDAGEPPFMTRMMFVLRAFPNHFRNHDSWKILSRYRYMLQRLPASKLARLTKDLKSADVQCPNDAAMQLLDSWTHWRNWDIPYVNQTMAFKIIFGPKEADRLEAPEAKATTFTFRSELVRIAVEGTVEVSDFILQEVSLGVENAPPTLPQGLMLLEENKRTMTVVQFHMDNIAFSLGWGLFDIVESIVPRMSDFQNLAFSMSKSGRGHTSFTVEDGLFRHELQLVLSTETASMTLRSLNLRHVSRADGLKMSILSTDKAQAESLGQCISAIVNFDCLATELFGVSQRIWQTVITTPSLYIDRLEPAHGLEKPVTVTVAVAYDELQVAIVEQIPGILHIIDSVIIDEVTKVKRLMVTLDSASELRTPSTATPAADCQNNETYQQSKFHIGILAGAAHIEMSLLQSLRYRLDCRATSVRIAPSLMREKTLSIDFDVGRQDHAFVNTSSAEHHITGILNVPPINGHIGLEVAHDKKAVSFATTVEKIEVEAGALQEVAGVLSQPEVQNVISAIKAGVDDIHRHVQKEFPPKPNSSATASSNGGELTFEVRFALLGIRVSATTPKVAGQSTAEVEFGLGPVHVTASNRSKSSCKPAQLPEIRAEIQGIGADLRVRDKQKIRECGNASMSIRVHFSNEIDADGHAAYELKVRSNGLRLNAYPETAATVIDVINHLQDRIKHLDLSKELDYLRRLRDGRKHVVMEKINGVHDAKTSELPFSPEDLLSITTTVELLNIHLAWIVDRSFAVQPSARVDDLVFSIQAMELTTRRGSEARLTIQEMQLQLAQKNSSSTRRSPNSALLPEVGFSVSYWTRNRNRSFALKATGKPLDVRLESRFLVPMHSVQRSIEMASKSFRAGRKAWQSTPTSTGGPRAAIFDAKRVESLLIEAEFAGARVYMQGFSSSELHSPWTATTDKAHRTQHGNHGQFTQEGTSVHTTLTAPGMAFKLEFNSNEHRPTINAELRIDASSNMLLPHVVPLVLEVTNSVKEIVQRDESRKKSQEPSDPSSTEAGTGKTTQKFFEEESIIIANPAKIFGRTKVNLGFHICKQEFGLSCQPIARVDARASLEDFYFAVNTIESQEHGHFFATSAVMTKLTAHVKHMYSREPTFSYDMESIVLSAMNNKHLNGTPGISAILNINPTHISINGKQFQDLLLFREIWIPPEIRTAAPVSFETATSASSRPEEYFAQRYQTVAAAAAFPWNATLHITDLSVDLDLGQSIGKSSFAIHNLWASQQKSSNWEQNLCVGLDEMVVNSAGRMSGFISLAKLGIRTSIRWPQKDAENEARKTPLIQASLGFGRLRAKAAFDFQAFAFGDIEGFDFLMYNVRESFSDAQDRLVAVLDCERAYVFCTSNSAAQAVGVYQAFDRLIQDKQAAYEQALKDVEKHLHRGSAVMEKRVDPVVPIDDRRRERKVTISLHTDVVVTMGALCFGVYPSTFFDSQMLKFEANNIQARFAVGLKHSKINSGLGMTLGQLQVGLSATRKVSTVPKALDISVEDVINSAVNSKGGTILRVPKVIASMQTWQTPNSNYVEYIFSSLFEGKIDVGWNLSRINFIKGMWTTHSRALASRLGKSLPEPAVKITTGPSSNTNTTDESSMEHQVTMQQGKITAEFNLPQSRYEYHALAPPVIETPQLRDMGEATPPLEWIGLQRERLPHVTHQIIIVSLLEVCKEVEDAYEKILGTS